MKKFFSDFKKFISRGNIVDMAVGVIIASAFTAIVTALTNKIIMPFINWLLSLGGAGLSSAYTFLKTVYTTDPATGQQVIDLTNSIYIDWGAFITAILNFLIIAFILFIFLKVAMKSSEMFRDAKNKVKSKLSKEDRLELKKRGISLRDKESVNTYLKEKNDELERQKAEEEAKKKEAEEIAKQNSTEYLLKEIRDLLKNDKDNKADIKSEE